MAGTKVERPDVAHAPVVRDPGVPEERQVVRRRPRPGPTGGTVKWVTGVELLSMGERVATY